MDWNYIFKTAKKVDPVDKIILKDPNYFKKQNTVAEKNDNTYSEDFNVPLKTHTKKKDGK